MNIMKKLTLKDLFRNKTRTIMTILGIMLSAALMTVVAGVVTSVQATLVALVIHDDGNYDIKAYGDLTDDSVRKLEANRNVENVSYRRLVGYSPLKSSNSEYKRYMLISAMNKSAYENCYSFRLEEGRFPNNSHEIILSPDLIEYTGETYKVGDKLTLSIGSRLYKETDPERLSEMAQTQDGPEAVKINGKDYLPVNYDIIYTGDKTEFFSPEFEETYTVVGILSDVSGAVTCMGSSACADVYTYTDTIDNLKTIDLFNKNNSYAQNLSFVNIDLTENAERDVIGTAAELFGIDKEFAETVANGDYNSDVVYDSGETEMTKAEEKIKASNPYGANYFSIHNELLRFKGFSMSEGTFKMLMSIAVFVTIIIIVSSVFIIRNSISISITEKTKLYGMLSSVGATPRQIRKNVLFESFILALVGIPLGIAFGAGVTAAVLKICDNLLYDMLEGNGIIFSVPWYAMAAAAVISCLTIFLSSIFIAVRAGKITAVEAIRSTKDINIKKKNKEKSYKTPKIVTKLFGTGGSIAYKNLKRSRKQYRTTIISIIVSVSVYITVFSFVDSSLDYSGRYYQKLDYNMNISTSRYNDHDIDKADKIDSDEKFFKTVVSFKETEKYRYFLNSYDYSFDIPEKDIYTDNTEGYDSFTKFFPLETIQNGNLDINIIVAMFDDDSYREILSIIGKSEAEMKGKAIITNDNEFTKINENGDYSDIKTVPFLRNPVGYRLKGSVYPTDADRQDEEVVKKLENEKLDVEIGAVITQDQIQNSRVWTFSDLTIILDRDTFRKCVMPVTVSGEMSLYSSDTAKTEHDISDLGLDRLGYSVINFEEQTNRMNSIVTVLELFVYGLIIAIALIGLTNIFNTITTNMNLRKKEFAMLRSIGMTGKEFRRMIRLESFFYAFKSLIIAIPLGLLGGYAINLLFNSNLTGEEMVFNFPIIAVLISIAAVTLAVWLIMIYSVGKIRRQNIIETIRNENV